MKTILVFINIKCDQVCHFEKCNCGHNDNDDHDRECAQDLSSNFVSWVFGHRSQIYISTVCPARWQIGCRGIGIRAFQSLIEEPKVCLLGFFIFGEKKEKLAKRINDIKIFWIWEVLFVQQSYRDDYWKLFVISNPIAFNLSGK